MYQRPEFRVLGVGGLIARPVCNVALTGLVLACIGVVNGPYADEWALLFGEISIPEPADMPVMVIEGGPAVSD